MFWLSSSDACLQGGAWLGLFGALVVLLGFSNAPLLALLWALYLSFTHVGQIFYGYGWDSLLCETGFLAIFLAPGFRPGELDPRSPPPQIVLLLFRWLEFRLMFGAGLIKLRGDECWTDLTCLAYHYETQPNPGPLSPLFHAAPLWFHELGALFNHLVEVVAPFGVFGPRRLQNRGRRTDCRFSVDFDRERQPFVFELAHADHCLCLLRRPGVAPRFARKMAVAPCRRGFRHWPRPQRLARAEW